MFVQTITVSGKVRLTQRFGRLEFLIRLNGVPSPVLLGNIMTALNSLSIEVFRISQTGSTTLIQSIPFGDALIASTANEGLVKCSTSGGVTTVRGSIELSDHGSLAVMDNDYYELVFTGLFPPFLTNISIYAVDYDTLTRSHNIYETVSVDANAPRELNVANCKLILLPKANLTRVELLMSDGTRNTYEREELESIVRDGLETIAIDEGKAITMDDTALICLNVASALTVRLTFSALTIIRKISSLDIQS